MKRSKSLIKTYKETPADSDSINASLLARGGFVEKHMAGAYALLPLGFSVYSKIENIIRDEMNKVEGQELLMNVLQPRELWEETGRWSKMSEVMYQFKDSRNKEIGLGATHEEQIIGIVRHHISSYKDLPISLYQIQTKFRNEPRAKSGLLRGREFIMKDMYSFHIDEADFEKYYQEVIKAYFRAFSRCGIETKLVEASGGVFSEFSHEFQALATSGEDTIFYCNKCDFAQNREIAKVSEGDKCPKCDGKIVMANSIEVGNIFPLSNKYSSQMNAKVLNSEGKEVAMIMGCYGIGLTRLLGTAVELFHDDYGIIWPKNIAPFSVNLISLNKNEETEKIYKELLDAGIEVLYDDREEITAGEKFADADLIGCPITIVVSERSFKSGGVEIANRKKTEKKIIKIDEVVKYIKQLK
jgi:prolyl-tRNA synthetase